jgi:HSP20 family molecular chaperone IbpA
MAQKEKKRSFFERLTGSVRLDEEETVEAPTHEHGKLESGAIDPWATDEEVEGELAIDVYQTPADIIVQTFVAGVSPADLEINITRDMIVIRGKRVESAKVMEGDFFSRELYWGTFSRTISLPHRTPWPAHYPSSKDRQEQKIKLESKVSINKRPDKCPVFCYLKLVISSRLR